MAEEVVVANGVVFAYGSGEDTTQTLPDLAWNEPNGPWVGGGLNPYSERRIPNSRHATLYALDGQTGKELWSSGNQITSWNHFSGLTVANGRAYLGTFDGTMYCFGIPAAAQSETVIAIGPADHGHCAAVTYLRLERPQCLSSQNRGNPTEWPTAHGDAQHTSWVRSRRPTSHPRPWHSRGSNCSGPPRSKVRLATARH